MRGQAGFFDVDERLKEASSVPIVYQLRKSVGHSVMALSEVVMPYLDNAANQSWRGSLLVYRSQMQTALDTLEAVDMPADWRINSRALLQNNIAFMDAFGEKDSISIAELRSFTRRQAPMLKKISPGRRRPRSSIGWALSPTGKADRRRLGQDLRGQQYDLCRPPEHILFSVLAQFFGPGATNSRLMLIETISFATTPEDMLEALTQIIADRSVGAAFFGDYYLMDYELMGGDARRAVIAPSAKYNIKPFLRPAVPFGSHQWPTLITPGSGPASLDDLPRPVMEQER